MVHPYCLRDSMCWPFHVAWGRVCWTRWCMAICAATAPCMRRFTQWNNMLWTAVCLCVVSPASPTSPVSPASPASPVSQPYQPYQPCEPCEPYQHCEPCEPCQPCQPCEPCKSSPPWLFLIPESAYNPKALICLYIAISDSGGLPDAKPYRVLFSSASFGSEQCTWKLLLSVCLAYHLVKD
jgi:hypothetical protein